MSTPATPPGLDAPPPADNVNSPETIRRWDILDKHRAHVRDMKTRFPADHPAIVTAEAWGVVLMWEKEASCINDSLERARAAWSAVYRAECDAAEPWNAAPEKCSGCGQEIDSSVCHCGLSQEDHGWGTNHGFIAMGCRCHVDTSHEPETATVPEIVEF